MLEGELRIEGYSKKLKPKNIFNDVTVNNEVRMFWQHGARPTEGQAFSFDGVQLHAPLFAPLFDKWKVLAKFPRKPITISWLGYYDVDGCVICVGDI